ncbi:MAG: sterol desaturase family protein [Betaproteobacteria bacterium]|nr:sterol desaturase family protein [Betaproteobacteria bacterium]
MESSYLLEHQSAVRLTLFVSVLAAMALWEHLAPARAPREVWWRRWRTNLGVAVFNTLVLRVALPTTAIGMAEFAAANGWGVLNHYAAAGWIAFALGVAALDLVVYFQHVMFHSVPALARLHAAHHADPDFDTTTGIRFHPFEIVLSMLIKYAAIIVLGAPALAVLLFELLLNLTALFNHGNVRLPAALDTAFRWLLVTPDMHRIHHSVVESERNSNYGFCLAIWDRMLGTYTVEPAGGQAGLRIGLPGFPDPGVSTTFSGLLGIPFRAARPSQEQSP